MINTTDVLVIIALKEEFENFKNLVPADLVADQLSDKTDYYRFKILGVSGVDVNSAAVFIGDMGNEVSRRVTEICVKELEPKLVVNIGIAGAIDDELCLGDVVIATEAEDYTHRGKVSQRDDKLPLTFDDLHFGGQGRPTTPIWTKQIDNLQYSKRTLWHQLEKASQNFYLNKIGGIDRAALHSKHFVRSSLKVQSGQLASGPFVGASKEFKEKLKGKNRNFVAIEMEAFGVLDAIHHERLHQPESIVLKGISDFGDERKKELDNLNKGAIRSWAARNAFDLALSFLGQINFLVQPICPIQEPIAKPESIGTLAETIHGIVINEYLKDPYDKPSCVTKVSYQSYSSFFKIFVECPENVKGNIFPYVCSLISKSNNKLGVEGSAGTGKSSFLSILYWYLMQQRDDDAKAPIPFLINFQRFNHTESPEKVIEILDAQLKLINHKINAFEKQEIWVIVDGFDKYAKFREIIWSAIENNLKDNAQVRIVGMRPHDPVSYPASQSYVKINFKPIVYGSDHFLAFISSFAAIAQFKGKSEDLARVAEQLQLDQVDLFTMSMIAGLIKSDHGGHITAFLLKFCHSFLSERHSGHVFSRATEMAFKSEILGKPMPVSNNHELVAFDLIHVHSSVTEFLIASYVCEKLRSIGNKTTALSNELDFVYPYKINRLCKEIINRKINYLSEVLNGAEIVLKSSASHTAKANACYIAGRANHNQLKQEAKRILNEYQIIFDREKEPVFSTLEGEKRYLLLARTLFISLSYLESKPAQSNYINYLMKRPRWDEFNRGFHLEYYGDAAYIPSVPLLSEDDLNPFPRTLSQLSRRLQREKPSPLIQVELYTLVSLAQHRHEYGKLSEIERAQIVSLIEKVFVAHGAFISDGLREYVTMVKAHLLLDNFSHVEPFNQLFQLKFRKRKGWVKRGIKTCESVADHTFGAVLIGIYFLPDKWTEGESINETKYSKDRILKMLVVHDLAEAVTGDKLPEERNEKYAGIEASIFRQIGMLGTYTEVAQLGDVDDLWIEFEHKDTINARLAKEIDRLENLVQLLIYQQDTVTQVSDFAAWRESIIKQIRTELGRKILNQLLKFYEMRPDPQRVVFVC